MQMRKHMCGHIFACRRGYGDATGETAPHKQVLLHSYVTCLVVVTVSRTYAALVLDFLPGPKASLIIGLQRLVHSIVNAGHHVCWF
jgi:hypothetical protein